MKSARPVMRNEEVGVVSGAWAPRAGSPPYLPYVQMEYSRRWLAGLKYMHVMIFCSKMYISTTGDNDDDHFPSHFFQVKPSLSKLIDGIKNQKNV